MARLFAAVIGRVLRLDNGRMGGRWQHDGG
jgi:hypothetical protein